jgi:nucleoside-diphosphate-sugar epimerase
MEGCEVVVHLAGRAHIATRSAGDEALLRQANVDVTARLADQAARSGVRRFVFVSSIKVHGESTNGRHAFRANDAESPHDPYGRSKLDAERALMRIASAASMEFVVVRPPLVYGPGAKANFGALVRAVACGLPLPLASIRNVRSFVSAHNLGHMLALAVLSEAAANRVFLVSDDRDMSTPELIREIARCLGVAPRLLPCPRPVLKALAMSMGRISLYERLCGSLQVDVSATRQLLGWRPAMSVEEAMLAALQPLLKGSTTLALRKQGLSR